MQTAALIDHKEILESAQTVEPLPVSVGKLAQLVSDRNAEIKQIVEVISFDQALTASVLRRSNSAASATRNPIRSVHEAVVRLGPSSILSIAFSSAVGKRMNEALPAYGLRSGELWQKSVACSLAAEVVRSRATADIPAEVSTAALLHDFGKVVLSRKFGPQVLDMISKAAENDAMTFVEAEQIVMGVNHADIGGIVAQHWKLPTTIVQGIMHHHSVDPGLPTVCMAVSLAHTMSHDILLVEPTPEVLEERAAEAGRHAAQMQVLGLDPAGYPELVEVARTKYYEIAERFAAG